MTVAAATMTGKERVHNSLSHRSIDQLPVLESFWGETVEKWRSEGHLLPEESPDKHFELDIIGSGWPTMVADLDMEPVVLEETDETVLTRDGNGALLRTMKNRTGTPEHVDFTVKDRTGWEELIKPHVVDLDQRRIPYDNYLDGKECAAAHGRFFCWQGVGPFEIIKDVCGHEHMLIGMAVDPEWVKEMVMTYCRLTVRIQEELFAKHGKPDGMFYFEDMGFKLRPFVSPDMYDEIMKPGHKLLFDFAHSQGLKVIVHSCGFVDPLVPGMIDAGMDCLQALEVKAGMDLVSLAKRYGDRISFCGGVDVREMISNDFARIDAVIENTIKPVLEMGVGYIAHSDHSIPVDVDYETYIYWLEKVRELGG